MSYKARRANSFSSIPSKVEYMNPRQEEIWLLEKSHQSNLNYLHFQSRLQDINRQTAFILNSHTPFQIGDPFTETDPDIIELQNELAREKKILNLNKDQIKRDIRIIKDNIALFRQEKTKQLLMFEEKKSRMIVNHNKLLMEIIKSVKAAQQDITQRLESDSLAYITPEGIGQTDPSNVDT